MDEMVVTIKISNILLSLFTVTCIPLNNNRLSSKVTDDSRNMRFKLQRGGIRKK